MAARRMFAKQIIDSDAFYDLPLQAQALYLHLNLSADDDGFVGKPKSILRATGIDEMHLRELIDAGYIIDFDTGIVVITHWKAHNYIKNDRYKASLRPEKQQLVLRKDGSYEKVAISNGDILETFCIQDGDILDPQDRIGKVSLDKDSLVKESVDKDRIGVQGEGKPNPASPDDSNCGKLCGKDVDNLMLGKHANVVLSQKELAMLKLKYPDQWERMVDDLSAFLNTTGKHYDRHYDIITGWAGGSV